MNPLLFGYTNDETVSWYVHIQSILENHASVKRYIQTRIANIRPQAIHRFVTTQKSVAQTVAAKRKWNSKFTGQQALPYEMLDITPLGLCRHIEEIACTKIPEFFVRFVPKNDYPTQWMHGLILGHDGFDQLLKREFTDAFRKIRLHESSKNPEDIIRHLPENIRHDLENGCIHDIQHFERVLFSNRKCATLEMIREMKCIANDLNDFISKTQECTNAIRAKIQSRINHIHKVLSTESVVVDVSEDEWKSVVNQPHMQMAAPPQTTNQTNELIAECERLCELLKAHKIDYIKVPSDPVQLQEYIDEQRRRQVEFAQILFDDSKGVAQKFDAENQIEKLQEIIETAQRKQFDDPVYLHRVLEKFERNIQPKILEIKEALRQKYMDIDRNVPYTKLPFKIRRLFTSDVTSFIAQSNTHFKCWLEVIQNHEIEYFIKVKEVRDAIERLFRTKESSFWVCAILFDASQGTTATIKNNLDFLIRVNEFGEFKRTPNTITSIL